MRIGISALREQDRCTEKQMGDQGDACIYLPGRQALWSLSTPQTLLPQEGALWDRQHLWRWVALADVPCSPTLLHFLSIYENSLLKEQNVFKYCFIPLFGLMTIFNKILF